MHLLAKRLKNEDFITALSNVMTQITGSYSMVFMADNKLIAMRDPHGVRPLAMGMMKDGYVFVSVAVLLLLAEDFLLKKHHL